MFKRPKATFIGICLNVYKIICICANNVGDDFSFSLDELASHTNYNRRLLKRVLKKLCDMQLLYQFYKNRYMLQRFTKSTLAYFIEFPDRVLHKRWKSSESVSVDE